MKKGSLFILLLFFPIRLCVALCEICEEEMEKGRIYSIAYEAVSQAQKKGLFSPFEHIQYEWVRHFLEYSTSYSIYRERFHHLMWWADVDFEESNTNLIKEIKELKAKIAELSSWESPRWDSIQTLEFIIEQRKTALARNRRSLPEIQYILNQGLSKITNKSQKLYNQCIEQHNDQTSFYERSLTYFDQGRSIECIDDISKFLETGQKFPEQQTSSHLFLAQGIGYSDLALYNQAIEALTEAIRLDPGNKDAYLERAGVYFEVGDFENSIEDFLSSDYHSTPIHSSWLGYATGFIWGASNGFIEAVDHFGPSLLASAKGLGNAIWTCSISPEQFSAEVIDACVDCVKFLASHSTPEIIEAISPNLKELVFEYSSLSNQRRGELIGHLIGKDGIEIFATAGGLKVYRELRRANMVATLETLTSSKGEGKILEQAEKWGTKRTEIIQKIKSDEVYIKSLKGQNLSESTIRKTIHELGYKTFSRPKGLPENYRVTFSDKKCGMKYIDPANEHNYVRVMPGNPTSPNQWQQNPYVNDVRKGQSLDKYGNKVENSSQAAHIPIAEFIYRVKYD